MQKRFFRLSYSQQDLQYPSNEQQYLLQYSKSFSGRLDLLQAFITSRRKHLLAAGELVLTLLEKMPSTPFYAQFSCRYLVWLKHISLFASLDDEIATREKALKTVVQGQQAENLLDFDEPDPSAGGTGLASIIMGGGASSNPATAKILTSSNPLDDLVSIFGNANINANIPTSVPGSGGVGMMEGLGGIGHSAPVTQAQPRKPQDDLLDLF